MTTLRSTLLTLAALAGLALAAPASAQRDPAYEAARAEGTVGERTDGYLALTGGGDAALRKMVDDINIRRRAIYARRAQAEGATMEEYSFTAGCISIGRTRLGEKYQAPDGSWQTRGDGPPQRDARCPG
jgi:uncharacterized protein YdbL (DUF1318 family)